MSVKKNILISALVGIITGFCNGLFGSGGGTIVVPAMEKFLSVKPHKAHATALAIILPLSIISAFIYVKNIDVIWQSILYVSIGGVVGGFVGAKVLNKVSAKWLHIIFGGFMLIAAVRMIL